MSSQIQEFVQMISTQVGIIKDDNVRKNNEKLISDFKDSQSDLFVQLLLQCLDPSKYDSLIRIYAITSLRKNLSDHSQSSFKNIYPKISQETQQLLKTQLFVALDGESAQNTRLMIADAIGEIGSSLIAPIGQNNNNPNAWPELIPTLWKLFQQERNTMTQAAFKILSTMLLYCDEMFEPYRQDIKQLFINGLNNSDTTTKAGCMEAIGAFIGTIEPSKLGDYYDLVPVVFQNLLIVSKQSEDDCEKMLEVIADLCEEEPKWYKSNFQLVFNTLKEIYYNKNIELSSIKRVAIEIPILIVERYPGQIKNNEQVKKDLIEMIFMHMIEIDEDIEEKWMKPEEGFRENFTDDGDNADTQFGMSSIDRLMESVGQNHLMSVLSALIQNLLQNSDWRYPFSALMALSQIGTYMEDVSDLVTIMPVIMNFLSHQNPKVRYAVYHTIGQISDDMKPDFQNKFHDQLYPLMVKGLDDQVPRVQSHCLASMTNYMEGVTQEQIKPFLQETLQKSFVLLQNGISLIKENALCNISACAEAANEDFHAYYKEALPIIFQVFQNHQGNQYKQLRGCVIEAISVIGESIEKELFIPYLNDTIQLILKIQDNDLEQVDPQKNFVLTGWSRICQKYSQEFIKYLPQVVPSVLKVIQQIIEHSAKLEDEIADDPQYTQTHTFQHREAETAMNTIEIFIENLGVDLGPYIQQFTELLLPLCHYKGDSNIRSQASKCLPGLIACVIGSDRALAIRLVKEFIGIMYGAAESEYEAETITVHIQSMKSCIEVVGEFMNQDELNQLSQKILDLLIQSDKRKTGNAELAKAPDAEEEDVAIYDLDNTCEEKLHVSIAELLGILFKTHADLCGELSEIMYNKFLPSVLSDSVSERMHQFGIFLIDDFIEFLQFKRVSSKWPHLCEALIKYSAEKDCAVRQATVYGIGIFAEQTPASEFGKYAEALIKALGQALEIKQQENQTQKTYTHCVDNTVAALGKMLKAQWQQIPQLNEVVNFWLSKLPLKKDKGEAYIQHQFLCDLVLNDQTQNTLFNDQNNFKTVVHLLVKLIESKVVTPEITESVKKALIKLSQNEVVKNNWNSIIQDLDNNNKEKLQKLF